LKNEPWNQRLREEIFAEFNFADDIADDDPSTPRYLVEKVRRRKTKVIKTNTLQIYVELNWLFKRNRL